jgi:Bacterial Ig-like domain (group 2)
MKRNCSAPNYWKKSAAVTVATINAAGLATATGTGTTNIQGTSGSVSGSTTLTVTPATLASVAVTPANPSIAIGKTQQFTATGTFSDGTTQNLTSTATWNSSSTTVATINTTGLATAVGKGSTIIQAVSGTISGSTTLSVASGVPVLVRSAQGSSSTGHRNGTVSFNSSSSAGDTIVLFLRFGGATVSQITDNQVGGSNTYTSVIGPTQWGVAPNVTDRWAQVFVAKNIKGGSRLNITVALSGNSTHDIYMAAVEYSGVDPVNPVNATASRIGTVGSNGAPTTGNLITTVANAKLVATGWDSNESYTSASNGAGYATNSAAGVPSISGGTGWANLTEDQTAVAPGAWKASSTSTRAVVDWVIQLIALAPAGSGQ